MVDATVATGDYTWKATKYVAGKTLDVSVATGVYTWNATKYVASKTADVSVATYSYMRPPINVNVDNYHLKAPISEIELNG